MSIDGNPLQVYEGAPSEFPSTLGLVEIPIVDQPENLNDTMLTHNM